MSRSAFQNGGSNQLRDQIRSLRAQIVTARSERQLRVEKYREIVQRVRGGFRDTSTIKLKTTIKADGAKNISMVDWGTDGRLITTTSGSGNLPTVIGLDVGSGSMLFYIAPEDEFTLCTRAEKSDGRLVGIGGLNQAFVIYTVRPEDTVITEPKCRLANHEGYVQTAEFVDAGRVITGAGDSELRLFDIQSARVTSNFIGHTSDVMSLSKNPKNADLLLSSGCDFTARLWDFRANNRGVSGLVATFDTQSRDVNDVDFFPDGHAFATAQSDSKVGFYDIRASALLATIGHSDVINLHKAEQVSFSKSGRLLFARYQHQRMLAFDMTKIADQDGSGGVVYNFHGNKCKPVHFSIDKEGAGSMLAIADQKPVKDKSHPPVTVPKVFWPGER